ncbi:MAG TPA: TIGR03435 family protein [Bryobacteraceae bacterium]|nr:TIGR03435 family protein [Bryobacteraceae bacterium]
MQRGVGWTLALVFVKLLAAQKGTGGSVRSSGSFQAASIKRSRSSDADSWRRVASREVQGISGNLFRAPLVTVTDLIEMAYAVKEYEIAGAPRWASTGGEKFDVVARADTPGKPADAELRSMIKQLLSDRFRLSLHSEMRETAVYELLPDSKGIKLKEVRPGSKMERRAPENPLATRRSSIEVLVSILSNFVDRPIVDLTGLTAEQYDYRLDLQEAVAEKRAGGLPSAIFSSVREDLGLVLRPAKRPIRVLVVDHVERPSEN